MWLEQIFESGTLTQIGQRWKNKFFPLVTVFHTVQKKGKKKETHHTICD